MCIVIHSFPQIMRPRNVSKQLSYRAVRLRQPLLFNRRGEYWWNEDISNISHIAIFRELLFYNIFDMPLWLVLPKVIHSFQNVLHWINFSLKIQTWPISALLMVRWLVFNRRGRVKSILSTPLWNIEHKLLLLFLARLRSTVIIIALDAV